MGRGQSVGRDGGDKGRGMRREERDCCFKEISFQIERMRQGAMMGKSRL